MRPWYAASARTEPPPLRSPIYCYDCQYDLQGTGARSCPECGRAFDPDDKGTWSLKPLTRRQIEWQLVRAGLLASGGVVVLMIVTLIFLAIA